jgi:signal transduction histidine kinase
VQRLGETLNEMLDRLESARERERDLLTDAGHELRTPLARYAPSSNSHCAKPKRPTS